MFISKNQVQQKNRLKPLNSESNQFRGYAYIDYAKSGLFDDITVIDSWDG